VFGAGFALASAAFFGLNNATIRRGVIRGSVLQAMAITVPLGVPLFVVLAAMMGGFEAISMWHPAAWGWMVLAGLVHFVFGRYGNYKATQLLGATLSAPVQQLSILVALVAAFLFLGERIDGGNLIGVLLVLVGPMALAGRRGKATAAAFEPSYGPGVFWGVVAALGYGTSPLFIALGIGSGGTADAVGGLLVSYAAASVAVLGCVAALGGPRYMGTLDRASAGWFLLSALFVALSQFFRYIALALAPVSVVTPIQRLSVVFRLIFNAMLNREHEVLDRWVIAAVVMSVIGAALLAADTAGLLKAVGLPMWVVRGLAAPLF